MSLLCKKVKKEFHELVNYQMSESRAYFDRTQNEVEICEDISFAEDQTLNDNIVFFPTDEELYPYHEAMFDFLNEYGINIPQGERAKPYLRENGLLFNFYIYRESEMKCRLLMWLNENDIQLEII